MTRNSRAQLLQHNHHSSTTSPPLLLANCHPLQAGAEEAPELTPEEYGRLVELVEQQEKGMR